MKKLYLVDVSSMFFRAFYAVRPLTSPSGLPVNAIYGFISMVTKILQEEKPEYMVFCYDRKEPSFRKELYDDYKANRTEMPEDLGKQIPYIKQVADLLGIPSLEVPQYEADDLIGTLAILGRKNDFEVIIVSGDKDFGQLIQEHVFLWDTMKEFKYGPKEVLEKWGVTPEKFIDYLAIVGDSSDNVPGVTGIGPKGAIKLLDQYGTLEKIYENIEQVTPAGTKEKLVKCHDQALLSKRLVTIVTDVAVDSVMENYKLRPFQSEALRAFLRDLNFKTFEKKLLGDAGEQGAGGVGTFSESSSVGGAPNPSGGSSVVGVNGGPSDSSAMNPASDGEIHFQYETLPPIEIQNITLENIDTHISPNSKVFLFSHEEQVYLGLQNQLLEIRDAEKNKLGAWSDDRMIRWAGFDLKTLWHEIDCNHPIVEFDSMLAAYALKAGDCSEIQKVLKNTPFGKTWDELKALEKFECLLNLEKFYKAELEKKNFTKVLNDLELPLIPVLFRMEKNGVKIDLEFLKKQSGELAQDIGVLEKKIHELAGEEFNIASPKQLGVILFEKLQLPAQKKTKTGYSTDTDVLQSLDHPIAKLVLEYRELAKLKSTYVDSIPALVDGDARVHTHFNQALTATGRLSSTEPNLQNIPIRTERGKQIRKAFIACEGKKFLSLDYSQIELRILAHITEDPQLCRAFRDDLDIHAATAAEIYNIPLDQVTSDLRRAAKAVNFGIAYGQGAFGLAENLEIGRKEAQEIIDRYFQKFKNVKDYIQSTIEVAHEKGFVETLFGRRRYIDELKSSNAMLRKFGERAAINAPIQGTASDLVKKAMIDIFQRVDLPMLLQVHDELIFEGTEAEIQEQLPFIKKIMENVVQLKVPLKVNAAYGNNWDEAH